MNYFDYNATSPYSDSVKNFIKNEMVDAWANPSSEHAEGGKLANEIKLLRNQIAEFLGCSSRQLVFTSGATESINTVLSPENVASLNVGRIISSPMEHHATLDRLKFLKKKGFKIEMVKNDSNGVIDLAYLEELLTSKERTLVSLLFANNETGVINPVKDIASIVHRYSNYIHIDGVQALGKINFNLDDLDVDFMSFSGHKIGALKGIGLLYASEIKNLQPLLHGGGQERGYRPGTLNFSAIKSLALAIQDTSLWNIELITKLRDELEVNLKNNCSIQINCETSPRLCNTTSLYLEGKDSREILNQLSRVGIYVSTGSACSSGSFEPSHVIKALGRDKYYAGSCLRISLSHQTSKNDLISLIETMSTLLKEGYV